MNLLMRLREVLKADEEVEWEFTPSHPKYGGENRYEKDLEIDGEKYHFEAWELNKGDWILVTGEWERKRGFWEVSFNKESAEKGTGFRKQKGEASPFKVMNIAFSLVMFLLNKEEVRGVEFSAQEAAGDNRESLYRRWLARLPKERFKVIESPDKVYGEFKDGEWRGTRFEVIKVGDQDAGVA